MAILIPVKFNNRKYPRDIEPKISEFAAHFDKNKISSKLEYSIHTDNSYGGRDFNNEIVGKYKELCDANMNGVPMLWHTERWAIEFADFIKDIADESIQPKIIEVHPPFSDYLDLEKFMSHYKLFKERVSTYFPDVKVFIENRNGTSYKCGDFIISDITQLLELSNIIDRTKSDLRIALDLPSLLIKHDIIIESKMELMVELFAKIKGIKHNISAIHLWGKEGGNSHFGDLNSYFMNDTNFKNTFLEKMFETFNDGVERYFVPEVMGKKEHFDSIIDDLMGVGFTFKQ